MEQKERSWFIKLLKPNKVKILILTLLVILAIFIPLYPTHTYQVKFMNGYYAYENHTTLQPLFIVLTSDFKWITLEQRVGAIPAMVGIWVNTTSYHEANPIFLSLYMPYTIILYIAGCFISEWFVWQKKFNKGFKDL